MYIYANGCSMTYGSELHDDAITKVCDNDEYRWYYAWPSRLGERLDAAGVYNDGVPSGSNDRIVRTTVGFAARWLGSGLPASCLMVIIGWSHAARREFYVNGEFRQVLPTHDYRLRGLNRINAAYRRYGVAEEEQQWRFAVQVISLSAFLGKHGIRHFFFHAVNRTPVPAALASTGADSPLTDARFIDPDSSMIDYLGREADTIRGQHPSEAGHLAWAARLARAVDIEEVPRISIADITRAGFPVLGGSSVTTRLDRKKTDSTRIRQWRATRRSNRAVGTADRFIYP
jgi:uncharacterized protein DUF6071